MPYITSIERRATDRGVRQGREEGRQEGRGEGVRESVLEALATRFGAVPDRIAAGVQEIEDVDDLRTLLRAAVAVGSLPEFEETLRSASRRLAGRTRR
jgi:predicted transposase YdaD